MEDRIAVLDVDPALIEAVDEAYRETCANLCITGLAGEIQSPTFATEVAKDDPKPDSLPERKPGKKTPPSPPSDTPPARRPGTRPTRIPPATPPTRRRT